MNKKLSALLEMIICPGCGWIGKKEDLKLFAESGICPICNYENGLEPFRLLTIQEILADDTEYNDVRLDLFLRTLFVNLGINYDT